MGEISCQLIRLHFLLTWSAANLLAFQIAMKKGHRRYLKFKYSTLAHRASSRFALSPFPHLVGYLQHKALPIGLPVSSPLFPRAGPSHIPAAPGATNRWLCPPAWHSAAEQGGAQWSEARGVRGARRHSQHLPLMSRPSAPKGPIFT